MNLSYGICKNCGKKFNQSLWSDGRYGNRLYCSSECAKEYYIKTHPQISKICKNCGKIIDKTKTKSQIYCSSECAKEYYIKTHPKKDQTLVCKVCGKVFNRKLLSDGQYSNSKYCSDDCKIREYTEKSTKAFSICKQCGKTFVSPKDKNGVYYVVSFCSDDCRNKYADKTRLFKPVERICKNCGITFIQNRSSDNKSFCSDVCKEQYVLRQKYNICKNCGKKFNQEKVNGTYSRKEFCSNKCASDYQLYKKVKYYSCAACGKKFERRRLSNGKYDNNQACCSVECENSGWEKKSDYRILVCANCGKEFKRYRNPKTGMFSGTAPKYCSVECQNEMSSKLFKDTFKEKYGVDHPLKVDKFLNKWKNNCIKKYGTLPCLRDECKLQNDSISKINTEFAKLLKQNNIAYDTDFKGQIKEFVIEGKRAYDFHITNTNILIEINPTYTHSVINPYRNDKYDRYFEQSHLYKTELAESKGMQCIHIWQWDSWDKIIKQLKKKTKQIHSSDIKVVSAEEAKEFLGKLSFDLRDKTEHFSIALGLYDNGSLAALLTFVKSDDSSYELLSLVIDYDYANAEALFNELWKTFVEKYKPSIVQYKQDYSKLTQDFIKNNFVHKEYISPQKLWSPKHEFKTDYILEVERQDSEEYMITNKWLPIYNCGYILYEWRVTNAD